jgi:hypothetical protein
MGRSGLRQRSHPYGERPECALRPPAMAFQQVPSMLFSADFSELSTVRL